MGRRPYQDRKKLKRPDDYGIFSFRLTKKSWVKILKSKIEGVQTIFNHGSDTYFAQNDIIMRALMVGLDQIAKDPKKYQKNPLEQY